MAALMMYYFKHRTRGEQSRGAMIKLSLSVM